MTLAIENMSTLPYYEKRTTVVEYKNFMITQKVFTTFGMTTKDKRTIYKTTCTDSFAQKEILCYPKPMIDLGLLKMVINQIEKLIKPKGEDKGENDGNNCTTKTSRQNK